MSLCIILRTLDWHLNGSFTSSVPVRVVMRKSSLHPSLLPTLHRAMFTYTCILVELRDGFSLTECGLQRRLAPSTQSPVLGECSRTGRLSERSTQLGYSQSLFSARELVIRSAPDEIVFR